MSALLPRGPMLLFCTEAYEPLAERLIAYEEITRGALLRKRFPDGERYLRILEECSGRDAVVLGGTVTDADTLELFGEPLLRWCTAACTR